ncbi:primosomal protein N' [Alsobacter metallidurans]|uniref:Replication restart protein PriA n=1 Tax=Alsobacter metallidurans TaxID=340221 RepID=A0A917MJI5_9HYPH|nr:primosomal protein N' [Alsobacter metallidurans]GGH31454.1 primosomal protein N' [Alsobacter metallidurans]
MAMADAPDTDTEAQGALIAEVLTPVALDQCYSYAVPDHLDLAPGCVVQAPFGPRETVGVVWELRRGAAGSNLKKITAKIACPPLSNNLRKLVDWVARYTLAPKGMVLRMALRAPDPDASPERITTGVRLSGPPPSRMTPARQRVLAAAEGGFALPKRALADAAAVSVGVIDGLVDEGTLETVGIPPPPIAPRPDPDHQHPVLEAGQADAAQILRDAVLAKTFSVTLLEGVTGSGKTEVYFEAVAEAIRLGRQTLIMLPEIALTAQFLQRFEQRFGVRPAEWHSGATGRRRERTHAAVASGEALVVAGARSALFLPFRDLGLVVVDEEHEHAFKQEDGVHYHARDMAVVRGRIEGAPVVLASATPSIESRVNAQLGRYGHVRLPERFGGRAMPDLAAIDMRRDGPPRGSWLSPRLVTAVRETLERGEQSLLYLNRRGYAPLTLCNACGHRFQCPNCTAWLVEHRFRRALVCHHCGHVERRPDACPSCGALDCLAACGPGVERLAEEVAETFPGARALVLSSDFPGGTERLKRELEAVAEGEFQIVIGTQLVAKGHNFPMLSLVGVVDADLGLASGDPRAGERTFQILQQVTGRAGRGATSGRALLQSFQPDHPVLKALLSGDAERFYKEEIAMRQAAGLPPFGRLAAIVVSADERGPAETHARALARCAPRHPDVMVLGPAEAPIAVVRGRHRFRLLVKTAREFPLQDWLRHWLREAPKTTGNTRVQVDVDPMSFL